MNTVDLILSLISQKGITKAKLLSDTGLNRNSFVNWRKNNSQPKSDDLKKIANYLGVSVDYLLGRESTSVDSNLSAEEQEVLSLFSQLNPAGRDYIMTQFDYALSRDEYVDRSPAASDKSAV